jgi:hypothetical protein
MIKKFYSDDYKVTHTEYAYDQNGNLAYKKCSTILRYCHIEDLNEEYWYRYDENNRKVYCKYACWYSPDHNCEEWYIYDEHGDVVKELRYTKSGCECRMLNMPTMEFII